MHRFFLPGQPMHIGDEVDLTPIRRQLARVLRMQPGDTLVLLNGDGYEYITQVQSVSAERAAGTVLAEKPATGEPQAQVTLYQCVLKGDKMEWVLQKGTELGIARFVPVISERTIVRPAEKVARKYDRWRAILREAAEQCQRGRIPELENPLAWSSAIEPDGSPGAIRYLPWEAADGATTLAHAAYSGAGAAPTLRVSLLIGPEGGITDGEAKQAIASGWQLVTLGPRILRAETAALCATSVLMSALGELE
ncbi:MAG: 16S rRNA (uracil(1498)-N(3))-methyltransferase [Caldilineaceae bacterium]